MSSADIAASKRERLKNRITEIDILRGIAVVLMVFDHFMYDIWGLMPTIFNGFPGASAFWTWAYGISIKYWVWKVREVVRFIVVFTFLALTGVSCSFSKSNLKRGLILMGIALGLTLATYIVGVIIEDPEMTISFGILHLISLSIITIALLEMLTKNKWVYLALSVVMITVGAFLLKEEWVSYRSGNFFELFFKQFIGLVLLGPDGYSFIFYGGQIFFGVFLGKLLYPERKPLLFKKGYSNNPLTFVGRHSLIVYVAHQVIIPVILVLAGIIAGYQLAM